MGPVFRMQTRRHPHAALKWQRGGQKGQRWVQGREVIGTPRETRRRTIEKEIAALFKTWN